MNLQPTINKDFARDTALEIIKTAKFPEDSSTIQFITQLLIARCNRGMRDYFNVSRDNVISNFKYKFPNVPRRASNTCYRVILLDVINKTESEWLREHDYYVDQLNIEHPHEKAPKVKLEIPSVSPTLSDNIFDRVDSFAQFLKENNDARDYWGRRYESFLS
jgi:hypothetical protein